MKQTEFPFPPPGSPVAITTLREDLIEQARDEGVGIVHVFDYNYPKGGLTVAFRKISEYKSGIMVECAVATCSPKDTFSKKVGTQRALEMFFAGETIGLPLLMYSEARDINGAVKRAFTALYENIM